MTPAEVRDLIDGQLQVADPAGVLGLEVSFDDLWTERHPSGFNPLTSFRDVTLTIHPGRIAETIEHLGPDEAEEYVLSVSDWLLGTVLGSCFDEFGPTAVRKFIDKFPSEATVLAAVASHHDYSLAEWLCGKSAT